MRRRPARGRGPTSTARWTSVTLAAASTPTPSTRYSRASIATRAEQRGARGWPRPSTRTGRSQPPIATPRSPSWPGLRRNRRCTRLADGSRRRPRPSALVHPRPRARRSAPPRPNAGWVAPAPPSRRAPCRPPRPRQHRHAAARPRSGLARTAGRAVVACLPPAAAGPRLSGGGGAAGADPPAGPLAPPSPLDPRARGHRRHSAPRPARLARLYPKPRRRILSYRSTGSLRRWPAERAPRPRAGPRRPPARRSLRLALVVHDSAGRDRRRRGRQRPRLVARPRHSSGPRVGRPDPGQPPPRPARTLKRLLAGPPPPWGKGRRLWAGNRQPQHERRPTAPCRGRAATAVRSSGHGCLGSGPPRPPPQAPSGAAVTGGGE